MLSEYKGYTDGIAYIQDIVIGVVLTYVIVGIFQSVVITMTLPTAANTAVNNFFASFWSIGGLFIVIILVAVVSFIRPRRE